MLSLPLQGGPTEPGAALGPLRRCQREGSLARRSGGQEGQHGELWEVKGDVEMPAEE